MYRRLFLNIGNEVVHHHCPQWGIGIVVEAQTSVLSGGTCLVRIAFRDGVERRFMNDLDDYNCCYYAGIRFSDQEPYSKRARRA